jgi:hypothetical protein
LLPVSTHLAIIRQMLFFWGGNYHTPWSPLWSSGQSSWIQVQRSGFDSRRYQNFWEVAGLERGPLSLVSTIEELLGRKSRMTIFKRIYIYIYIYPPEDGHTTETCSGYWIKYSKQCCGNPEPDKEAYFLHFTVHSLVSVLITLIKQEKGKGWTLQPTTNFSFFLSLHFLEVRLYLLYPSELDEGQCWNDEPVT